jgi:hypothetical protein
MEAWMTSGVGMRDSANFTETSKGLMAQAEQAPDTLYLGTVIGSIFLSALLLFMGKKELSIFVGLWPPTLLGLARMMKERRPSREL